MINRSSKQGTSRRFAPLGIVFAFLGLFLFAFFVRKAGLSEIAAGIKRLGAGFLLILALSAVRQAVRSLAWTRCFELPHRLRFREAFVARVMGDALGNIIPLASVAVSEPSKAFFVRHRVPLLASVAALALENIFYSLSVVLFIFSGATALLLNFSLPKPLRYASFATLITTTIIVIVGFFVINQQWRFLSGASSWLHKMGVGRSSLERALPSAQALEERVYGFYKKNRGRLAATFALELCFHLAGVVEVYTTLSFISDFKEPTLLIAFILESVNRVINVVFKFIPLRTGVDEAGTGMLSKVLGFTTAIGVTLAIVRKARDIFWTAIGVSLIVRRGFSLAAVTRKAEEIAAEVAAAPENPLTPSPKPERG
jgi:glycosyltransferase 2 family protein